MAFAPVLLVFVLLGFWLHRRRHGRNRLCRWRAGAARDGAGRRLYRCAACGAEAPETPQGAPPPRCLRDSTGQGG